MFRYKFIPCIFGNVSDINVSKRLTGQPLVDRVAPVSHSPDKFVAGKYEFTKQKVDKKTFSELCMSINFSGNCKTSLSSLSLNEPSRLLNIIEFIHFLNQTVLNKHLD